MGMLMSFFFSSRRRHTRFKCDWSSDVCSSDLGVKCATVVGSAAHFTPGGKGANQAVAAARLGATVRMVGCVGDDDFGRQLLASLRGEGVEAGGVRALTGAPTGLAMISVGPAGDNLLTVAPRANTGGGSG